MFFSKSRRIAELEALAAMLRRKLDAARGTDKPATPTKKTLDWEAVAKQLAADRTKAERAANWEIGRLEAIIQGWTELSAAGTRRIHRLARVVARHRKTITEQAATIVDLTGRLDRWEGGDRAISPAPPPGTGLAAQLADAKRQIATRDAHIKSLDARLATLELANRAGDHRSAPLKAAS